MIMPDVRAARKSIWILAIATYSVAASLAAAADVVSSWVGPGSANWSDPANWSSTPPVNHYPNNGNGGFTYDAIITAPAPGLGVTLSEPIALQRLTIDSLGLGGDHNL